MRLPEDNRVPNLNTSHVPAGVDNARVRKHLLERHGIQIAGGLGPLAGKIFRIGLMGRLPPRLTSRCFWCIQGSA